jgi:hypothetical protein
MPKEAHNSVIAQAIYGFSFLLFICEVVSCRVSLILLAHQASTNDFIYMSRMP